MARSRRASRSRRPSIRPPPRRRSSGITARIKFTNNLIDSTDIQGSDPILSGASGRLWLSTTGHRMRLELQGQNGDAQVVLGNGAYSIYDPTSNTLYKGTLPSQDSSAQKTETIPTVAQIQSDLNRLMQQVNVVGPLPRNVAGQPAYKVEVSPKHDGGLLGDVQLAWDAAHGIPLGIAIYSRSSSSPVLELKATHISYGQVKSSAFSIKAPAGAKVVKVSPTATGAATSHARAARGEGQAPRRGHRAGRGPVTPAVHAGGARQARRPSPPVGFAARLGRAPGGARHLRRRASAGSR